MQRHREPVTVEWIAEAGGISVAGPGAVEQGAIELFGKDLSDSAIAYRMRRDRELGDASARPCAEAGCPRALPAAASTRRRYCNFHLAPHSRIRPFRERRRSALRRRAAVRAATADPRRE